jgi:hypothetical protein
MALRTTLDNRQSELAVPVISINSPVYRRQQPSLVLRLRPV